MSTGMLTLNLIWPLPTVLNKKVTFLSDCVGPEVEKTCQNASGGEM